jgi:NAD(P) transhydrogenase
MTTDPKNYDLVVIGGGPAGITAATTAAGFHKRVALVDNHKEIGGAGVNTGTVPSKTLRETALALSGIKSRNLYGVDLSLRRTVTVADFLGHEENVKDGFHHSLTKRLVSHHTDIYWGACTFADPHTLNVRLSTDEDGKNPPGEREVIQLRAAKILIATGSSPVRPDIFPFGQGEVYDSDTILKLDRIPKTLAAIGAGVIGAEYACTFQALGTKVHILDGRDVLLPFLDREISQALQAALERSGIVFHWKERVEKCINEPSSEVRLDLSSGTTLTVDAVLVAAGRQSNTGKLDLDKAGVKTSDRGLISVDEHYRTNVEDIYAAGDVIGFPALASTSMEQARRATRHALGLGENKFSSLLPNGIYTIPEVSMIGETEESLQKKGVAYIVGRASYQNNARGRIIGDQEGMLKLLFRQGDLRLLGVHIMGELATEVVHIGLMAMMCNAAAELFVDACFNIPTLGHLYKTATLEALQKIADPQGA